LLNKNSYIWTGFGLLIAGSLLSLSAYFLLHLTWLTALGVGMLILSSIFLALGKTIPRLPPEVSGLLLETGIDNIAAIIEELGIKTRAIYLPSSLTGGRPQALIPLHSSASPQVITRSLPQRFIVRYGNSPDDVGLLLSTIGSTAVGMLESRPDSTPAALESALTTLLTGILGMADRVSVIYHENLTRVEIYNPRIEKRITWSYHCLGGPLASIVAAVAAEAWDRPVAIKHEEQNGGKYSVEIEALA